MNWKTGPIEGVIIDPFSTFTDERGWLSELFRMDMMPKSDFPEMGYISATLPGMERGPHEHTFQSDRFGFFHGHYRLFLWDSRKHSPTFGSKTVMDVGADNMTLVTIPPGVVHAYKNVGDSDAFVLNFPNKLYAGTNRKEAVDEIRHEDMANSPYSLD